MKRKSFEIMEKFYKSIISRENLLNLPEDRLSVYQSLVFNNIEDTCSKAFPIAKTFLKEDWEKLIKNFIKNYKFTTPYLWEVPKDFIKYLEKINFFKNREFIYDLMIYEWIEIEVFNEDLPAFNEKFNWCEKYRISNSAKILSFKYPVHKINKVKDIKELKGSYFLIIYQNPENYEIEYLEITPFLYQILERLSENYVIDVAKEIANKYGINFENISNQLEEFFKLLSKNKIITK